MNKKLLIFLIIIVILLGGVITWAVLKPMPTLNPNINEITIPDLNTKLSAITWPDDVQAAIGAKDYGVIATQGDQSGVPIASIAKTMLALSVLEEKPLQTGEEGSEVKFTQADIDKFNSYLAENQSVVPIAIDEPLTEYQALQALMLPSGNNIADALASWAFGSVDNYLNYANAKATEWGLTETHFADASGFSPKTVSSAQDLVMLGEHVYDNPVLSDIVSQEEVTLPVAGTVYNVNSLLGQENIIGIKTGNTDEAGGCFLFATKNNIDGKETIVITAILGDDDLATVLADSLLFAENNSQALGYLDILNTGEVIGTYDVPWSSSVNVVPEEDVTVLSTKAEEFTSVVNIDSVSSPKAQGEKVGEINITSESGSKIVPLVLENSITSPSFLWKLTHLFYK